MKFAIGMLCVALVGTASAEEILVRAERGHQCVGDEFQLSDVSELLYLERRCELQVSRAAEKHAYVSRSGGSEVRGCWLKLSDGNYSVMEETGGQQLLNALAYAQAKTTSSSTAKIVRTPVKEPDCP
ncbi:hypothetical protein [Metapseudomonas otitidis]|uniref:hypothetical protein n=1 Tax=Metapseudomonas otitidis TaxID=319939 RepID=UPI001F2F7D51|nr:hypothetical protein [Pseudomonas otitidis]